MNPQKDTERIAMNRQALQHARFDALVCALPANVLMLSGYCPVLGNSVVITTADSTMLIVPSDETDLAQAGWANDVRAFENGSLTKLESLTDNIAPVLKDALRSLNLAGAAIGYEQGPWVQPTPYVAMTVYGPALLSLLSDSAARAKLTSADNLLKRLGSIKSTHEIAQLRRACGIAGAALADGPAHLRAGQTETEAAARVEAGLLQSSERNRAMGRAFCMSGPNAAEAYKAYQRSSQRELRAGDLVLLHCNSNVGGFWTDITRTFCLGSPTDQQRRMYDAVLEARGTALAAIKPGARAAEVDHAARAILESRGFGKEFKHPTGHGVGFSAIDHDALPRLHPLSSDILEARMVFNVEPAVYFSGECGLRHCEMVAVTSDGAELLTPFQSTIGQLVIDGDA